MTASTTPGAARPTPENRLGEMMTSPLRLLVDATAPARGWFATAAAAAFAGAAAALALPATLASALDAVVAGRSAAKPVFWFVLLLVTSVLGGTLRTWASGTCGALTVAGLRRDVATRGLHAGASGRAQFPAGDLTSRFTVNCTQAGQAPLTLLNAGVSVLTSLGGVMALWMIDWRLGVTFLLGVPPALLVMRLFMSRSSDILARYHESQGRISALLLEAIAGARSIAAGGTTGMEVSRVLGPLPEVARAGHHTWLLQRDTVWQLGLLFPAVQVLVLAVGGYSLVEGRISAGQLTAVVAYTMLAMGVIDQIDSLFSLSVSFAGARRVTAIADHPLPAIGARDHVPAADEAELTFRGVTVRTDDGLALDAVDLDVPAGTSLALVGRSGSGKSTLTALLGRLRDPDEGEVRIGGVPVDQFTPNALRDAVCYAFERPEPLGGTIRGMLTLSRPDASDRRVTDAARAARAHHFISRLPRGYATPLREAPLSGGEMQRLGLARALVHDAVVVVLDDATSSLDTATEAQVDAALADAWAGRTRVVVAHRLSTAARADLVVWLDAGRVRALGPHARLWQDPGYRELFGAGAASTAPEEPLCRNP